MCWFPRALEIGGILKGAGSRRGLSVRGQRSFRAWLCILQVRCWNIPVIRVLKKVDRKRTRAGVGLVEKEDGV
ncbi:uncharacterized protein ANIA_11557 [Aspergillus nidulans FGSC A4]|uniref:Uncharacterized protein n=1 Tax=Emericella nidulans (strain FGSC A4 / ATCC 38163 / CBS 112.46 / NRRL 194 / M139) TaxID=227321 RepID=C8VCE3_EMENI|nr:hypothetical protein [Aspergillus nidulans FGSC A4]CBF78455.1 TPA: hypothetical protein ANIA_11557 [Aspergillus nidulans FGSC A4]